MGKKSSSTSSMASCDHLFTHCSDAVCVAEDASISFFAPKTLKKFRVESVNGARICGIYVQNSPEKGNVLHVIDAEWNWFVISLKKIVLEHSTKLHLPFSKKSGNESEKQRANSEFVPRKKRQPLSALVAQFYERQGALYSIILTSTGVYEVMLVEGLFSTGVDALYEPKCIITNDVYHKGFTAFDILLAVGRYSGLIALVERGGRMLRYSLFEDRMTGCQSRGNATNESGNAAAESSLLFSSVLHERILFLDANSVACSPTGERVAVGGARGELAIYTTIRNTHHFSDHWHHTPLRAMCFSSDGASLITGAQEDVLLVWNMSNYSQRKIRKAGLGPVRSIVPSISVESTLMVASGFSTLTTVDLLQMLATVSVEGIEWSAGAACTGFFFTQWMGQSVVLLTGLPHVLRLIDPLTQQAVHSLHLSSQMEALPSSPRHRIALAACLREGNMIITYETFGVRTVLPSQLCFWVYNTALREHQLVQTVYAPHDEDLLALCIAESLSSPPCVARLFTLSSEMMKCWSEVVVENTDALSVSIARYSHSGSAVKESMQTTEWCNQSTSPTPSHLVQSMLLSDDGSICFVVDDAIHLYDVRNCSPGVPWTRLAVLSQGATRSPLRNTVVNEKEKVVYACSEMDVFAWSLVGPTSCIPPLQVYHSAVKITSMTPFNLDRLLVAAEDCSLTEIRVVLSDKSETKEEARTQGDANLLVDGMPCVDIHFEVLKRHVSIASLPIEFMQQMPFQDHLIGVVDGISGFRVVRVEQSKVREEVFSSDPDRDDRASTVSRKFSQFFLPISSGSSSGDDKESDEVLGWGSLGDSKQANRWLRTVLQDAPYTAPPMSTVFAQYLVKSQGGFEALKIE